MNSSGYENLIQHHNSPHQER